MTLDVSGSELIAAPRQRVYQRLLDLPYVAQSAPGVERVEGIDPTHFTIRSAVGIGPIKLRLTLAIELFEVIEGRSATMRLQGKGSGSRINLVSQVRVADAGPGRTSLEWGAAGEIAGTAALAGTRLMHAVGRRLTTEFWRDFARRVSREK